MLPPWRCRPPEQSGSLNAPLQPPSQSSSSSEARPKVASLSVLSSERPAPRRWGSLAAPRPCGWLCTEGGWSLLFTCAISGSDGTLPACSLLPREGLVLEGRKGRGRERFVKGPPRPPGSAPSKAPAALSQAQPLTGLSLPLPRPAAPASPLSPQHPPRFTSVPPLLGLSHPSPVLNAALHPGPGPSTSPPGLCAPRFSCGKPPKAPRAGSRACPRLLGQNSCPQHCPCPVAGLSPH